MSREGAQQLYEDKIRDMRGNYARVEEDIKEDRAADISEVEECDLEHDEKQKKLKEIDEEFERQKGFNYEIYAKDMKSISEAAEYCSHNLLKGSDDETKANKSDNDNSADGKLSSPTEFVQELQEGEMPDYNDPDL